MQIELHPLFRPLDSQARMTFDTNDNDAARIAFIGEAAFIVCKAGLSLVLNDGREYSAWLYFESAAAAFANEMLPILEGIEDWENDADELLISFGFVES